jgi:inorganic triphosphatase YgiF
MPAPHETEFKFRLDDQSARDRILGILGAKDSRTVVQTNWIFDTEHRDLDRHRFLVRLRQEDGRNLLTAKAPGNRERAGLVDRPELEVEISADRARSVLAGMAPPLSFLERAFPSGDAARILAAIRTACAGAPLRRVGSYETERVLKSVPMGADRTLTVALDRTTLPRGRTDYEIEIELPGAIDPREIRSWIEALFREARLALQTSGPKVARFYAALDERSGD